MKLKIKLTLSCVFALSALFASQLAEAGAWNLPKGDGQVIMTSLWTEGGHVFDEDGNRLPINGFSKSEGRMFFEHGLTDKWTLTGNGAFQTISFDSPQSQFGFQDFDQTELGLRYQLHSKPGRAIALQASYILDGGPQDNILDISGGEDQVELRAFWGQSLNREKHDVFFDAQIAARMDLSGRYDSTYADLTLGYKPNLKWLIMLQTYGATREPESDLGFTVGRQSRIKINPSITYHYKKRHSIQIGYTATLWGENIVQEDGVTIGAWWRY